MDWTQKLKQLIERYNAGEHPDSLARELGRHASSIRGCMAVCASLGATIRKGHKAPDTETVQLANAARRAGLTVESLEKMAATRR